jgi:glycosyl transferase, family 25
MHHEPKSNLPAVIILTCKRSPPERIEHARNEAMIHFAPDQIRVLHGFIGSDREVDQLFDARRARIWSKDSPSRNEIAAYATHRLAWKTLLDGDCEHALILEDDFQIDDPGLVKTALEHASALLGEGRHLIKLFDYPRDRSIGPGIRINVKAVPLVKWERTRAGLVGYLLSREGAKRLLQRQRVFRVVDEDIKFFWELALDIWSIPGNPVSEIAGELGGSLLETERRQKRKRSLLRSLKGIVLSFHRDVHARLNYIRFYRRHQHCAQWPKAHYTLEQKVARTPDPFH